MPWATPATDLLWNSAWAVIPPALVVAAICRWLPCRPATRHSLWLIVLLWFLAPLVLPTPTIPEQLLPVLAAETPAATLEVPNELTGTEAPRAIELPRHQPTNLLTSPRTAARTGPRVPGWLPAAAGPDGPLTMSTDNAASPPRTENAPTGLTDNTARPPPVARAPDSKPRTEIAADQPRQPATASTPEKPTSSDRWRAWLGAATAVRNAVVGLPALPSSLWLAGIALLVIAQLTTLLSFHRRLRGALPAPRTVMRAVQRISRQYGLREAPQTVMVDAPISPMVLAGPRTRLILPSRLWAQLDRVGRKAILCHELAHLRRRDHWVCRLELLVSTLYWWHPVAWWTRRRLNEEADFCCDAWVRHLMPEGRRAYAEALLRAKQFVSESDPVPAVGMGVRKLGAKRFARRLTMVMTDSTRPRLSVPGIALVCMLAMSSWVTTPAWSCPDKKTKAKKAQTANIHQYSLLTKDGKTTVVTAPSTPAVLWTPNYTVQTPMAANIVSVPATTAVYAIPPVNVEAYEQSKNTFLRYVQPSGAQERVDTRRMERQIDRLQKELDKLSSELDRMKKSSSQDSRSRRQPRGRSGGGASNFLRGGGGRGIVGGGGGGVSLLGGGGGRAIAGRGARRGFAGEGGGVAISPGSFRQGVRGGVVTPSGAFRPFGPTGGGGIVVLSGPGDDKTVARTYKISKGKLEALTRLMVRSDVPILVSPKSGSIEVNATAAQHRVFKAFVEMIDPNTKRAPQPKARRGGRVRSRSKDRSDATEKARDAFTRARRTRTGDSEHEELAADAMKAAEKAMAEAQKIREKALVRAQKAHEKAMAEAMKSHEKAMADAQRIRQSALAAASKARRAALAEGEIARKEALTAAMRAHEEAAAESKSSRQHADDADRKARSAKKELAAVETEVRKLARQAEKLADEAEKLEDKAEVLEEKAEDGDDEDESDELEREARKLRQKAKSLRSKARSLSNKARQLKRKAGQIRKRAERERRVADDSLKAANVAAARAEPYADAALLLQEMASQTQASTQLQTADLIRYVNDRSNGNDANALLTYLQAVQQTQQAQNQDDCDQQR